VLERRRAHRAEDELRQIVVRRIEEIAKDIATGERWDQITDSVIAGNLDPWSAADQMLDGCS
jgi:LAO/AO transport system kinase